jgi:hypothetical protein
LTITISVSYLYTLSTPTLTEDNNKAGMEVYKHERYLNNDSEEWEWDKLTNYDMQRRNHGNRHTSITFIWLALLDCQTIAQFGQDSSCIYTNLILIVIDCNILSPDSLL